MKIPAISSAPHVTGDHIAKGFLAPVKFALELDCPAGMAGASVTLENMLTVGFIFIGLFWSTRQVRLACLYTRKIDGNLRRCHIA